MPGIRSIIHNHSRGSKGARAVIVAVHAIIHNGVRRYEQTRRSPLGARDHGNRIDCNRDSARSFRQIILARALLSSWDCCLKILPPPELPVAFCQRRQVWASYSVADIRSHRAVGSAFTDNRFQCIQISQLIPFHDCPLDEQNKHR
jgi:hypothetical protein